MFPEIPVDPEYVRYLRGLHVESLTAAREPTCPIIESPTSPGQTIMRHVDGHCCMLQPDRLCAIHGAYGYEAKPPVCREYPFKFIRTPGGTFVGLSFACSAVLGNAGPPLIEQGEELESKLDSVRQSFRDVRDPLLLTRDIPLTWAQYTAIEEDLDALLDPTLGPIGHRLVLQSVYLRLLIESVARARGAAAGGGHESDAEAIEDFHRGMRDEDGRGGEFHEVLQRGAARRPTPPMLRRSLLGFAHALCHTYTQRLGRLTAYWRLTRQYFRFTAGSGTIEVPDAPEIPPVPYTAIGGVEFDPARPELDELLTRYFRHQLFRKDLAMGETVRKAQQMSLMHWGLIHWYAAALAAGAGARAIGLEELSESIRIVERLFVFHTSFDTVFSQYPMMRGPIEKIFQNPLYALAMAWGEWVRETD